jgi:hypothetical protein
MSKKANTSLRSTRRAVKNRVEVDHSDSHDHRIWLNDNMFLSLDAQLTQIEIQLPPLLEHMALTQRYTNVQLQLQQHHDMAVISRLYLQHYLTHRLDIIHVPVCIAPDGAEITTFGSIMLAQNDTGFSQWNYNNQRNKAHRLHTTYKNRQNRNHNAPQAASHKNVTVSFHVEPPIIHYVIVESLHALSKGMVDKKMKHMEQVHKILREAASVLHGTDPYHNMIQQWRSDTYLPIDQLDHPIQFVFSSDNVSASLLEYIVAIHDGMTEETYDRIVHQLLFEDTHLTDNVKAMTQEITYYKTYNLARRAKVNTLSMKEIRRILIGDVFADKRIHYPYMIDYITPFSELEETFRQMRHHVGVLRFGHVSFSTLFREPALSSEAGHAI